MVILIKNSLKVEIYTIGYEPMGEGIVIKIIVDNVTKYCAVIDYFEQDNQNKILELIKNENIDLICLTHPDLDHCKGMEKIFKLVNNKTKILYPCNIFFNSYTDINVNKVVNKIAEFHTKNRNNSKKPILKGCVESENILNNIQFAFDKLGIIYDFQIDTYTPLSSIIDKNIAKKHIGLNFSEINHNDFSIMMSIAVGSLKILLCGDVEDSTLIGLSSYDKINNFLNDNIHYIKIPHHSSNGSVKIFSLLSNVSKISNSVSTVYRTSGLPNPKVLEMYKLNKKSNVFCTGNVEKDKNVTNYGIVKHSFDIINQDMEITLLGNAYEYE